MQQTKHEQMLKTKQVNTPCPRRPSKNSPVKTQGQGEKGPDTHKDLYILVKLPMKVLNYCTAAIGNHGNGDSSEFIYYNGKTVDKR